MALRINNIDMKVALLTPLAFDKAETFIKNHISNLPFEIVVLYGGKLPHKQVTELHGKWQKVKYNVIKTYKTFLRLKVPSFAEYMLTNALKREKVDVVFAEYLHVGAEVTELCEKLNIPLVAIGLGYEISTHHMLETYHDKYKKMFQYAKAIFVVSEHMKHNIFKIGCNPKKVIYTPAGPAKEFFELTPNFKSNQLVSVGRFVDKKAPHLTILAFQQVLKIIPNAILVMAGDGPLWSACKDLVKALGIQQNVKFVGRISTKEHQQLLEESIAFVQHSKVAESGDSEGTPVAILEASAAGLPIVSTLHAGIPNVVQQNITGFLVQENDVSEMAKSMIWILQNKSEAKSMGAFGKSFVAENFTLKQHIETIAKHLEAASEIR